MTIGQPSVTGDLDKAIVRRYIKRNAQKLQYCYEKALLAAPTLAGTVDARFVIALDGQVTSSTATGVDPTVSSCVASTIKSIEFPKPKGGDAVQVSYPFVFRPADGAGGSRPPTPPTPPPPEPPKPQPAKPAPPYRAGGDNPLVGQRAALEECFRMTEKRYGAIVVRLDFDATGAVTAASADGVDDGAERDDVRDCVVTAAKQVKGAKATSQRCSVAFGTMPVEALPALDITAEEIRYAGAKIADVIPIARDDSPTFKIDALFDKVDLDVQRANATTVAVAIEGPLVVKPIDATPIRVVTKVTTTLRAAGSDFVLAARRDEAWKLLRSIDLPVVPVPRGTGGSWSAQSSRTLAAEGEGSELVTMSILVQRERIWIGLSRVNEFQEIPARNGQPDLEKLVAALVVHKKSAFFVDRTDLEIAGEDVTYGDVARAIEAVQRAGFVDFSFVDPAGLEARPTL